MIKVLVNGAAGKVGSEVVKAVSKENDLKLVGGIDVKDDLKASIRDLKPDVVVDFTHPSVAFANAKAILESKAHAVIGTTGLTDKNLAELKELCKKNKVNCIVAPNFAIGAVLMMMFSKTAAKYMPNVEIIELHHDKKADSPSGTAIKTAEMILEANRNAVTKGKPSEIENIQGARGANIGGIYIHSVRLPGYVAHQEVIFGGLGQTLTIRHDTISRESFMPGVIMAIRKIQNVDGFVYGLENLL